MKFNLQSICEKLGEKNSAVYAVVAVALFKGILRPLFTMMDKKENPKSKKYAAIREGSTELIAIPTYICMSKLAEKLAPAFSPEGKSLGRVLENTKTSLGFIGVCFAAVVAIPGLCNLAMPSVLALFKDKKESQQPNPVQSPSVIVQPSSVSQINPPLTRFSTYKPGSVKPGMGVSL